MTQKLADNGYTVLCDWTSSEHQCKPKIEQWLAIRNAIRDADVVFLSFHNMEKRTSSATFAQFHMATAFDKRIVVYDPAKATRAFRNNQGQPVHPSFSHLMGHPLFASDNVFWTADFDEAIAAL